MCHATLPAGVTLSVALAGTIANWDMAALAAPSLATQPSTRPVAGIPRHAVDWDRQFGKAVADPASQSKTVWLAKGDLPDVSQLLGRRVAALEPAVYQVRLRIKTSGRVAGARPLLAVLITSGKYMVGEEWITDWPHDEGAYHEATVTFHLPGPVKDCAIVILRGPRAKPDLWIDTIELIRAGPLPPAKPGLGRGGPITSPDCKGSYELMQFSDGHADLWVGVAAAKAGTTIRPCAVTLTFSFGSNEPAQTITVHGTVVAAKHPNSVSLSRRIDVGQRKIESLSVAVDCEVH